MKRIGSSTVIAAALCAIIMSFASSASASIIYVKWDSSGTGTPPVYDGLAWGTAFHKVQDGLNAASSGDEVWVAGDSAHPYYERITLKSGVGLYGGFSGVETSRTERNSKTNVTILDGQQGGSVVTSPTGATTTTVIDGFTIEHGNAGSGGGVCCMESSGPRIANNRITRNVASGGGGICCLTSLASPEIIGNLIVGNRAAVGGGVSIGSSSYPTITNNTIVANGAQNGGGIYNCGSSSTIANNVVAFNSSGVYQFLSGTPYLRSNDVYGNTAYNYSGLSAGTGDISVDPLLASKEYGNMHIQPGSPCVNAGWNDAPGLMATDVDGQARVHDDTVDIGADETYGETWVVVPAIIRVTATGDDINDGSAWDDAHAKNTVQAGIDAATAVGGEVWVKAGTYNEGITLYPFAYVFGGFAGTETSRSERNWSTNVTILDGGADGSVATITAGEHVSALDGLTVRNGSAVDGGGVCCYYASPTIANSTVLGNTASGFGGGGIYCAYSAALITENTIIGNTASGSRGGGICCNGGSPTIANNSIVGNTALGFQGGAIYCTSSSPTIDSNEITGNITDRAGGAVYCYRGSPTITGNSMAENAAASGGGVCCSYASPVIVGNVINNNRATFSGGGGICCSSSSPTIYRNSITANAAVTIGGGVYYYASSSLLSDNVIARNTASSGGAMFLNRSSPVISHNTIAGNAAAKNCGGIYCQYLSSPTIFSNVLAFNSSGVYADAECAPLLRTNCVHGNSVYDYSGLSAGAGDISEDTLFVDRAGGDYHLMAGSPCVDAGTNDGAPATDLDGFIRPQDGNGDGTAICDIGAYEFPLSPSLAKKNYADGVSIAFGSAAVTAKFGSLGQVYVENLDRSSGVRVDTTETLVDNALVNVQGMMQTNVSTGERYVQALTGWPKPTGRTNALRPLTLPGKNIGGADNGLQSGVWEKRWVTGTSGPEYIWTEAIGLNNIGLLVTIIGKITYAGPGEFWIDDGSKLDDDSGNTGVKVIGTPPDDPVGKYVKVTGISTCEKKGDDPVRLIRALSVDEM